MPVALEPLRLNWYLAHSLVKVIFLLITENFRFLKIFRPTDVVFEGLPIRHKSLFLLLPNSPLDEKITRCAADESGV